MNEEDINSTHPVAQFLIDRSIAVICVALFVAFGGTWWYANSLSQKLIESNAVGQASQTANMLAAFRTIYTSDVVARVRSRVEIAHDFENREGAIPLPATLSRGHQCWKVEKVN